MKLPLFVSLLLFVQASFCQVSWIIDDFSERYFAEMFIADTNEVFSKGWIAVSDKQTKKELIKINADELTVDSQRVIHTENVRKLSYTEQNNVVFEDFNFDGIRDFALMDGQNSCYHGPSFQIYLAAEQGFVQSPEFTRLAQEYCGMFELDKRSKTIHTMTKSGCCWHQYAEFKVKENVPYAVKVVEEGLNPSGITWDYEEQCLVNGMMVKTSYQMLALEVNLENLILSFDLQNNKKMLIFHSDSTLFYMFSESVGKIELLFMGDFNYSQSKNSLAFKNYHTRYEIYEDKILIKTPKKLYTLKALDNSRIGSLKELGAAQLVNLK